MVEKSSRPVFSYKSSRLRIKKNYQGRTTYVDGSVINNHYIPKSHFEGSYRNGTLIISQFCKAKLPIEETDRLKPTAASKLPRNALFMLWLLYRRETREALLGDIREDFLKVMAEQGHKRAVVWCWCEVFRTAVIGVLSLLKLPSLIELARKLIS